MTTNPYLKDKEFAKSGDQAKRAVLLVTVNATEYPICSSIHANPSFVGNRPCGQPSAPSTKEGERGVWRLETTTTATTLSAGRVGGGRRDVLDTADLHAGTGQSTESGLGTGAGSLGAVTCGDLCQFLMFFIGLQTKSVGNVPPVARILMWRAVIPSSLQRVATS